MLSLYRVWDDTIMFIAIIRDLRNRGRRSCGDECIFHIRPSLRVRNMLFFENEWYLVLQSW